MIKGKNIFFRAFEKKDIDTVWKWHNDFQTMLFASSNQYLVNSKEQLTRNYLSGNLNKERYAICINNGELIGEISYWKPDRLSNSTVEVGTIIGKEEYRRMGYGMEAFAMLGDIIFNDPKIHKIIMYISDHNYMSKVPLEKAGMKKEGVIRKERYVNGEYYDSLVFGLLRDEFVQLKELFDTYF